LLLRSESGEPLSELSKWWEDFQVANEDQRLKMINALSNSPDKRKPRRRRRRKPTTKSE
jgi:poly(A) polymerase